jgi:hypothetical protein
MLRNHHSRTSFRQRITRAARERYHGSETVARRCVSKTGAAIERLPHKPEGDMRCAKA